MTVLPDVEALTVWQLENPAIAAGGVHGKFPVGPTYPLILAVRVGGQPIDPRWIERATMQIDVWADTKEEARDTAAIALARLVEMEGTIDTGTVSGVVTGVAVQQGTTPFPDEITEKPRYQCTVAVAAHP